MPAKRLITSALAAVAGCCLAAGPAAATGGRDIASAPIVSYGEQEFGNTATDGGDPECWGEDCHSWWQLPTSAGDRITLDFEGSDCTRAVVWPVGTTDFNVEDKSDLDSKGVGSNNKAELVVKASQTGSMPLDFTADDCSDSPGPYDFAAHVQHGLSVTVPRKATRPRIGTLTVGVHTPDGGEVDDSGLTVELQAKPWGGKWKHVSSATVSHSVAAIRYQLPKSYRASKKVYFRAIATGDDYIKTTSSTEHSKVS